MRGDFVIQVKTDAGLNSESFHGRVEHMDSGRSARFRSPEELVTFIRETIQREGIQRDAHAAPGSARHLSPKDLTKS
jgi:hypothetical protein